MSWTTFFRVLSRRFYGCSLHGLGKMRHKFWTRELRPVLRWLIGSTFNSDLPHLYLQLRSTTKQRGFNKNFAWARSVQRPGRRRGEGGARGARAAARLISFEPCGLTAPRAALVRRAGDRGPHTKTKKKQKQAGGWLAHGWMSARANTVFAEQRRRTLFCVDSTRVDSSGNPDQLS
jgi:hypothetical protein